MNNTKLNTLEVHKGELIVESRPLYIYVELTQRCNCSCLMCYRSRQGFSNTNRSGADMERSLYECVAEELFKTAEVVDLRGFGETTIYPDILDILDYNRRFYPDISYKLVTNGKLVSRDLMKAMAQLGLNLYVSFDAANKDLFEFLRRGNSYDTVVENIKKWNRTFSSYNTARLLVTLHRYNVRSITDIAAFAAESGCQLLSISKIDPMTGPEWEPERETVLEKINVCAQICSSAGMDMVIPTDYLDAVSIKDGWKTVVMEKCTAPWNTALIKYDGEVHSCSHRFGNMGSIIRNSFEDIWNGERFRLLRSGSSEVKSVCSECKRNSLVFIGTKGGIGEKTWALIDQHQAD